MLYVLAAFAVLAVLLVVFIRLADRRFARLPVTRIADCKEGQIVKIVGRAVPMGPLLTSPFTNRPCVAYAIWGTGPKATADEKDLRRYSVAQTRIAPFAVDDGSGTALVDVSAAPDGSVHRLRLDTQTLRSPGLGVKRQDAAADVPGLKVLGLTFSDHYSEGIIEPEQRVAVYAQVMWDPTPGATGGFREGSTNQVRLVPPQQARKFKITNQPRLIGGSS